LASLLASGSAPLLVSEFKRIIITGGENVSAKEVETVINLLEGVQESAVVGISDPKWGETVVAAVQLKSGCEIAAETIQLFAESACTIGSVPSRYFLLKRFPAIRWAKSSKLK